MINTVMDELVSVIYKRHRVMWADLEAVWPWACKVTFMKFYACGSPCFMGKREPIISIRWIVDVGSAFLTDFCPAEAKFRFAACLLLDEARFWWCDVFLGLELMGFENSNTSYVYMQT
ncbi:unnamed protein product [Lactuca saligna]|uniref:Uncharacterized protein n=1 Tax=Lactuca saligna TaxID=75948 RepID=A0AA35YPI6_LACSI|nr:unnamed protein product [Lactuca saligna]